MSNVCVGGIAVLLTLFGWAGRTCAQTPTPPKLLDKVEPEYTEDARRFGIQGTVVLTFEIDERGKPRSIEVLSPLGYGLDESAADALSQWRFSPGTMEGKPVSAATEVYINFRLLDQKFPESSEEMRTAYNLAVQKLKGSRKGTPQGALKDLEKLASENYPPAMNLLGDIFREGEIVQRDLDKANEFYEAAARKGYGPSIYWIAQRYWKGDSVPKDAKRGLEMTERAARNGSVHAQYFLGAMYETGDGIPKDARRAREMFRLCAAASNSMCQYRLANLLANLPERSENHAAEALAWARIAWRRWNCRCGESNRKLEISSRRRCACKIRKVLRQVATSSLRNLEQNLQSEL